MDDQSGLDAADANEGDDAATSPDETAADQTEALSRRRFIGYAGAAAAAAYLGWDLGGEKMAERAYRFIADPDPTPGPGQGPQFPKPADGPTFTAQLRRREDQLSLRLEFWNMKLATQDGKKVLVKDKNNRLNHLVVVFPPQHLAEQAFFESSEPDDPPAPGEPLEPTPPPIKARLAGPSRLAFLVPDAKLPMAYTVASLLNWLALEPSLVPNAVGPNATEPRFDGSTALKRTLREPEGYETAIELPWRLQLSPPPAQAWFHSMEPVEHANRTELWHTRLGVALTIKPGAPRWLSEGDSPNRMVRAIWATDPDFEKYENLPSGISNTPDFTPDGPDLLNEYSYLSEDLPFRMAMTARDRLDIVKLSGDFHALKQDYDPKPIEVEQLALTGLGGWLDSNFSFNLDPGGANAYNSSLLNWRHVATLGRDSYVRVVRKGWLLPFGFKAVQVQVTDRVFRDIGGDDGVGAYLRQRLFIVVTQPIRTYTDDYLVPHGGRGTPFTRMECLNRVTPDLDEPEPYVVDVPENQVFQVRLGSEPFPFRIRGTDVVGGVHDFSAMAVFVDDERAYAAGNVLPIIEVYNGLAGDPAVQSGLANPSVLNGRKVGFAPEKTPGDTSPTTVSIAFQAELPALAADGDPATTADETPPGTQFSDRGIPRFYPALRTAEVSLAELTDAGGGSADNPKLTYFDMYRRQGIEGDNKGGVFLADSDTFLPDPTDISKPLLSLATRNSGGMAAPALKVGAISRELGATDGAAKVAEGKFDTANVIPHNVKILGGIKLIDVLKKDEEFLGAESKALRMKTEHPDPDRLVNTIDWQPTLEPDDVGLFVPVPGVASCHIRVVAVTNLTPDGESKVEIEGKLTNFALNMFGANQDGSASDSTFIILPVNSMVFTGGSNAKDDLRCELGKVQFAGPFAYLQELAEFLSFADDDLKVEVTGEGIHIELRIPLPNIAVGVISLTNLAFYIALDIPFDGSPVELYFAFATRDNPFTVNVLIFGGGGFVGVAINVNGLKMFEFSIEFGAGYELDVGVASGKIEVKAGVYFRLETTDEDADGNPEGQKLTLEAYIRMYGEVDVMGLITASIEAHLKLIYVNDNGNEKLEGEAMVRVEVDVLIFSGTVKFTIRKELAKSGSGELQQNLQAPAGLAGRAHRAVGLQPETTHRESIPALPSAESADPFSFADNYIQPQQWESYCRKFALIVS